MFKIETDIYSEESIEEQTQEDIELEAISNRVFPKSVQPGIPKLKKCPTTWKPIKLGQVLKIISRPAKLEKDKFYQLVTAKRSRGGIISRGKLPGRNILVKTQFYIREGDFLVSRRQIVHGGCGIVPKEMDGAIVSNEYLVLHATNDLLQEYLKWLSHSIYFQQTCFHSSIGVHVEKMVFKPNWWLKFKFNLPSLPEQKKIAEILDCWEKAIEKTEKLIELRIKRKRGLMQRLLTGKKRFDEFTNSPAKINQLKDYLIEINTKNTDNKIQRVLSVTNSKGFITQDKQFERSIASKNLKTYKLVKKGQFAYNPSRINVGSISILTSYDEGIVSPIYTVFRTDEKKLLCSYCKHFFKTYNFFEQMKSFLQGSVRDNLSFNGLCQIKMFIPSLEEQQQIADILNACDKEIELLKQKLELLQDQKKDLIQKLLTGQIRVKVDN